MNIENPELKILKELQKIYADPSEREKHNRKVGFLCRLLGLILLVSAIYLNHSGIIESFECLLISFAAGISVAIGYYFTVAAKEVAVLAKYVEIKEEAVSDRIMELKQENHLTNDLR